MKRRAKKQSEYAKAGVNYKDIEPFKMAMIEAGKKTILFPNARGVFIDDEILHAHGAVFDYRGIHQGDHLWCKTQEGLGNKNWIAEWMYQNAGTGRTYYEGIGIDAALMIVNDLIAQGAMPAVYTDEVAAGDSEWFKDEKRAKALGDSYVKICQLVGMALPAGESPSLRYLIKAEPPVKSAPSLSGSVSGVIAPKSNKITGRKLRAGDRILGVTSSGIHANGISLVIKRALTLPDQFMTKLPNGNTLGDEALIATRSYVALIEALQNAGIDIHALLPGTGGGIGKVAFDKRLFSYIIHSWPEVPMLFRYMRELGVSLEDCLTTFNWGVGYYIYLSANDVFMAIEIGKQAGYDIREIGYVKEGERKVVFEPENITLPPPGD